MEVEAKTKKWGSSIGIIIPKDVVKQERIQEGQDIRINILTKKKTMGADIFGAFKFKKTIQDLLDETDKDFEVK